MNHLKSNLLTRLKMRRTKTPQSFLHSLGALVRSPAPPPESLPTTIGVVGQYSNAVWRTAATGGRRRPWR